MIHEFPFLQAVILQRRFAQVNHGTTGGVMGGGGKESLRSLLTMKAVKTCWLFLL